MRRLIGLLALSLPVLTLPVHAVELGNKEEGHAYVQKFCTECHAVEKDETMLFSDVPSFQEVADSEGMSPRALNVWLRSSHPNMPDFIIPPDDIDNIVAYIMSLRTPKE